MNETDDKVELEDMAIKKEISVLTDIENQYEEMNRESVIEDPVNNNRLSMLDDISPTKLN